MNKKYSLVLVEKLKPGDWIVFKPEIKCRVVDVDLTREGRVKIDFDYGNGGELATSFYERHERVVTV